MIHFPDCLFYPWNIAEGYKTITKYGTNFVLLGFSNMKHSLALSINLQLINI